MNMQMILLYCKSLEGFAHCSAMLRQSPGFWSAIVSKHRTHLLLCFLAIIWSESLTKVGAEMLLHDVQTVSKVVVKLAV